MKLFKRKEKVKQADKPSNDNTDILPLEFDNIIRDFIQETKLPMLEFTVKRPSSQDSATVHSTKLGGTPYLPPDFDYPMDTSEKGSGQPLRLLCQLNFSELPRLDGFPADGILQFYIAQDDLMGLDFDDLRSQRTFRVVYHKDVIADEGRLRRLPELPGDKEGYFPFEGEYLLEAKLGEQGMTTEDFHFGERFMEVYQRYLSTDAGYVVNLPKKQRDKIWDELCGQGHHAGGYPFFTQGDPREYLAGMNEHTTLLLQIDSDDDIMWGDAGVANFFIQPEKLAALDFSDVIYTWDCC